MNASNTSAIQRLNLKFYINNYHITVNVSNVVNRNSNRNTARHNNVEKIISLTVKNAKLWIKFAMLGAGTVLKKTLKYITLTYLSQLADTMMGFWLLGENLTQDTQSW